MNTHEASQGGLPVLFSALGSCRLGFHEVTKPLEFLFAHNALRLRQDLIFLS